MFAATTAEERAEDAQAKDDKEAKRSEQDAKKGEKKDAKKDPKRNEPDERPEDPSDVVLEIGNIVVTSAKKEKARFDNFQAEVLSIKKDKVRVKLLDGPAKGVAKDFPRCMLNLVPGGESGEDAEGADVKRQRLANDLFGDTL